MRHLLSIAISTLLVFGLGGCVHLTGNSAEDRPALIAQVQQACLFSPLFKQINGVIVLAVPEATIPVDLADAGITIICTNPTAVGTLNANSADWVLHVLARYSFKAGYRIHDPSHSD